MPNTIKPPLSAEVKALAELAPDAETREDLRKLASMLDEKPTPRPEVSTETGATELPSEPRSSP